MDETRILNWSDIMLTILEIFSLLIKIVFAVLEATFRLIVPVREKSVEGEIVLITGAGHGIGRELALQYAALNALVVCLDINEQTNKETVSQIKKNGKSAYGYKCDITNRDQVIEVITKVQSDIGDITILVNNAGILLSHSLLEHTKEELEKTMNTNVMAHFWTLQAVLPTMLKNNYGHIVALSSLAGVSSLGNIVPYCTSKFAVRGMMQSLKQELRCIPQCQIKLTTIYPLLIDTGLAKTLKMRFSHRKSRIPPYIAAKNVISAQRKNMQDISIPREVLGLLYLTQLLPNKVNDLINDFLGYRFESDL